MSYQNKKSSFIYLLYLPIADARMFVCIARARILGLCEMERVSSRIWTRFFLPIFNDYDSIITRIEFKLLTTMSQSSTLPTTPRGFLPIRKWSISFKYIIFKQTNFTNQVLLFWIRETLEEEVFPYNPEFRNWNFTTGYNLVSNPGCNFLGGIFSPAEDAVSVFYVSLQLIIYWYGFK